MSIAYQALGWLIFVAGAIVPTALIVQQVARIAQERARHKRQLSILEEELNMVRDTREKQRALPALWNGKRKFRVARKTPERGGICSFSLVPNDGKVPLPEFEPGQFLTFDLTIDGRKYVRCYSISDCYGPSFYRVSIKRVTAPTSQPGIPHGVVSSYFHEVIKEGDVLDVSAPAGSFTLDAREQGGVVLTGAGVGVTPVQSMVKSLLAARSRREVWFFYSVRDGSEDILKDRIPKWRAALLPNFHFHVCYSNPRPQDEQGRDFDHVGRVGADLFQKVLPSSNFDFFTCGPPAMMKGLREGLASWGVPDVRIHDEAFMQVVESVDVGSASVECKRSGKTLKVSGKATSLLDLATNEGIRIPAGCKSGHCGTCQTALISGSVNYTKAAAFKTETGCCLPCICLPKGNIVLDC